MGRGSKRGFFLVFEGGEGAGKSTQIRHLRKFLTGLGYEVLVTREPGGTELGKSIRQLLLRPKQVPVSARAEALLYQADRAQHVSEKVVPTLEKGGIVISDRFADSSTVYQGMCRNLGQKWIERLNDFSTRDLTPDLVIVMDISEKVGLGRAGRRRGGKDRMENEARGFHRRVRRGFLTLARRFPARYSVVDADRSVVEVAESIQEVVQDRLLKRR